MTKVKVHCILQALLALRGCTWRVRITMCGIICFRWLTPRVHRVNGLCRVLSRIILLISITIKSSSLQAVVWLSVRVEWWEGACNMVTALSRGRRVRGGGKGIESWAKLRNNKQSARSLSSEWENTDNKTLNDRVSKTRSLNYFGSILRNKISSFVRFEFTYFLQELCFRTPLFHSFLFYLTNFL